MSRIFITGSSDGLGLLAAKALIRSGHQVVLHARNAHRAKDTQQQAPGAERVLIADFSDLEESRTLAEELNRLGTFDAVIHNAAVLHEKRADEKGLPLILKVNTLAPYILTCVMHKPKRLVYMSSAMHLHGDATLGNFPDENHRPKDQITYADTKLHNLLLSLTVARRWKDVYANAVNPGWVPTKMGGAGAPDSIEKGYETQVWLAVSDEAAAKVSGKYFHHKKQAGYVRAAGEITAQDNLLEKCEKLTGIRLV